MRNRVMMIMAGLCALSFLMVMSVSTGNCAEGLKVIGKANIKEGTTFMGLMVTPADTVTGFTFIADIDQTVYVLSRIEPVPGTHKGGYFAQAEGFLHACPVHGREVMGEGLLVIPKEMVDDGTIEVILLEQGVPNG